MSHMTITPPGYRFVEKKPEIVALHRFTMEDSGRDYEIEAAVLRQAGFNISHKTRLMKGSDGQFYINPEKGTTLSEADLLETKGKSITEIYNRVMVAFNK